MKKKINIAELLKDCPQGMELDCTIYNGVKFIELNRNTNFSIVVRANNGYEFTLTKYGQVHNIEDAKCVIFPKGKTTWEGFQRPFKDGEIVACDSGDNLQLFIFKNKKENSSLSCCYLMLDGDELDLEEGMYYVTRLATEEEKEKLFKVIKDNGYKWNFETKNLEKLSRFKVGNRIKQIGFPQCHIIKTIEFDRYILDNNQFVRFEDEHLYKLASDKFDISTLKPFDKVLVRGDVGQKWTHDFFGFMDKDKGYPFVCVAHYVIQCIPYEGNEHLLGTTNECDDFYKTW